MAIGVCSMISTACCICLCWMKRRKSRCTSVHQYHTICWSHCTVATSLSSVFPLFLFFLFSQERNLLKCGQCWNVPVPIGSTHDNLISNVNLQNKTYSSSFFGQCSRCFTVSSFCLSRHLEDSPSSEAQGWPDDRDWEQIHPQPNPALPLSFMKIYNLHYQQQKKSW